uniref:Uncharacterized protein n=1 Tax=Oryza punctata TaxID=4537 RepID=A0A0E0KXA3_ORYPU
MLTLRQPGSGTPRMADGVDDRLFFILTPSVRPRSERLATVEQMVAANALDREEDWQSKGRERENEMEAMWC